MKVELPQSIVRPESRRPANRALWLVAALVLAVFTGWNVFHLPLGLVRRNIAPPDLYGKAWGLRELWIDEAGNWTIKREGFADRRELYKLTDGDQLWREDEAPLIYEPMDHSGIAHGSPKNMVEGFMLDVKASPAYWDMVRGVRRDRDQPRSQVLETDTSQTLPKPAFPGDPEPYYPLPTVTEDEQGIYGLPFINTPATMAGAAAEATVEESRSYVPLQIYHIQNEGRQERILPGCEYYPSMDSWAYVYPDLWLTTNNQQWLHHVRVAVTEGSVTLTEPVSTQLDLEGRLPTDCAVGYDPVRDSVFILRADGLRRWFDPGSLEPTGSDTLPGVWKQEYATIAAGNTDYVYDRGLALTKPAYKRLMRVLMVLFLASLLVLATVGRKAWKSTSAATTADTSSSEPSSTT